MVYKELLLSHCIFSQIIGSSASSHTRSRPVVLGEKRWPLEITSVINEVIPAGEELRMNRRGRFNSGVRRKGLSGQAYIRLFLKLTISSTPFWGF